MTDAEKMLLADAIATAMEDERKIAKMERRHRTGALLLFFFMCADIVMIGIIIGMLIFGG